MKEATKKVVRKHVKVANFELTKKERKSKYPKWKVWVADKMKLDLADDFQYLFRVQYHGSARLMPNDIVVNRQGVIFIVLKEQNRMAMLLTKDAFPQRPSLHGTLTIFDK